jgi:hypothetical protein
VQQLLLPQALSALLVLLQVVVVVVAAAAAEVVSLQLAQAMLLPVQHLQLAAAAALQGDLRLAVQMWQHFPCCWGYCLLWLVQLQPEHQLQHQVQQHLRQQVHQWQLCR